MKAAVYDDNGGPGVLRDEDAPEPMVSEDGVVLDVEVISVHTAGRDP
jgi:NADPH:quinone reductase-like Zn-dependent oxidoreductase